MNAADLELIEDAARQLKRAKARQAHDHGPVDGALATLKEVIEANGGDLP